MGRPPRHPSGRGSNVSLWLAPAEAEKLRRVAEARGVPISRLVAEWIRRLAERN